MKNPFCSFIIAVYNREKYVADAINSILKQTYPDFELIIVNDGSTDRSDEIIKSFTDPRVRYFNIKHKGCWSTKNYAIKKTKGHFLCFIDSDDYISPDFLQNAYYSIMKAPDYDYYYPTALSIVLENGEDTNHIWRYVEYPLEQRQNLIKLFWEKCVGGIPHAAAFISCEVFKKFGYYNDTFFNLSDTAYVISHAMEIRFHFTPGLITYYNRQHPAQTNANMNERMRTFSEILDEIIKKYPTEYFLDTQVDKDSPEFCKICVGKFMELANTTQYNMYYIQKAEKYLAKFKEFGPI